ncbi:MAG: selenocysteine synthase [Bryobacterales bacterium]|nr:selenocysteine synthase [Bryobacteraceae bacterium]MDW8354456.1 selenocysteine synthase [Bryobacterales bacterium]
MANRRMFLQTLAGLPWVGGFLAPKIAQAAPAKRDYLKELGVRPIINAAGTYTMLTGSLMAPEAVQAWLSATRVFVRLDELHDAVGKRIAELIGCEAAMVTAGAASALTLGTAACMTGTDPERIRRLPDTTGMKTEVIIQKSHRFSYDHAVRNCGIRFVEVETREELERAVSDNTVMMLFLNHADPVGQIKAAEFAELGKKHGIPTFIDCAADVPPVENLRKFTDMGFSLVTFSGGKGLLGPQSAGLLLGRKDLIQAARLNTCPHADTIGRGHKVNKEEMLAMLAAVEAYLKRDHKADWREWEKRVRLIADTVASIPGVSTEVWVPEIANHSPHLRVRWDTERVKVTVADAVRQLREGEPSIEVVPGAREFLTISVWMLQPGEAQIVARRLREILKKAAA